MKKPATLTIWLLALAALLLTWPVLAQGQTPVTAADVALGDYWDVQTNGSDSTYGQALTHRYVGGELQFLTLTVAGELHAFTLTGKAPRSKVSTPTAIWSLGSLGVLNNFNSLNWDPVKGKLWVTSAEDYTNVVRPSKISLVTLGANGSMALDGSWSVEGVNAKRIHGGIIPIPTWAQASMNNAKYLAGFGGYTSLVMQGGGASMGPFAVAIDDPTTYPSGAVLPVRKLVLDAYPGRGVRKTIPVNYFDSGDPRQNPSSPPTGPPLSTAQWLSPNAQGLGWFVWGDSYYNTGFFVDTPGRRGFGLIGSFCKGRCWYQSSTLAFDGRQFELHLWNPASLGTGLTKAPDTMLELVLPRGNTTVWGGNSPTGNIGGATFDPTTGRLWMLGSPFGPDVHTGRLYYATIAGGTGTPPPPPPTPTPAVLSAWSEWTSTSEWSACAGGTQTRTEQRTRTVLVPASGGAPSPTPGDLLETRTASQACTVAPPPPPTQTYPIPTATPNRCTLQVGVIQVSPDGTSGWTRRLARNGSPFGPSDSTAPYAAVKYSTLPLGVWQITAVWTKTGQPTVTTVLGTVECR